MSRDSFYGSGLRFECTRCSECCRHTPGYVFLSEKDLVALAAATGRERQEFLRTCCRQVSFGVARRISLKEKANLDCIFWEKGGCSVYDARPLQCRSFPFWSACVSSPEEWELHARQCRGMGKGALHPRSEIEDWLKQRLVDGFLEA
ncbi:MAG: YkgJ family cysteine cluster protein [Spirochaetia bacterium]|nr:YkgJ family cysteine cluster protein [Spirochaetia bacterium]